MCRGNNGQDIFFTDDGRRLFLSTLEEACGQTGWQIHAYVLMPNHYHLLLETPEPNLAAGMKWFQGTYTQRFNMKFGCRGHLFQGRYKALPVEAMDRSFYFREVHTQRPERRERWRETQRENTNPNSQWRFRERGWGWWEDQMERETDTYKGKDERGGRGGVTGDRHTQEKERGNTRANGRQTQR